MFSVILYMLRQTVDSRSPLALSIFFPPLTVTFPKLSVILRPLYVQFSTNLCRLPLVHTAILDVRKVALLRCWRLQRADTALNNALTSRAQRSTWEMSNSTGDASYLTWYQWIIHYAVNLPALLLLGLSLGAALIAVVTEWLSSDFVVMCI
jgi:hypothetical protein